MSEGPEPTSASITLKKKRQAVAVTGQGTSIQATQVDETEEIAFQTLLL
jgi:hypothetical protein